MKIGRIVNENLRKVKLNVFQIVNSYNYLTKTYIQLLKINTKSSASNITCIVFSMDRAMQLDALIGSFLKLKKGNCQIIVLYRTTTTRHEQAYQEVFKFYGNAVTGIKHQSKHDFKGKLLSIFETLSAGRIFFLVDDIIFTEEVDMAFLEGIDTRNVVFSLRMGINLDFSYVVNKIQVLPQFEQKDDFIHWEWNKSELDWAYPLSMDGHLFSKQEMEILVKNLDYSSPNSLEDAMQVFKDIFSSRLGMSYKKARIFNNPCNKVQKEIDNFHGNIHQDTLLNYWEAGKRIKYQEYYGYVNKSVHEEVAFKF